jgi:hypothetical protein
MLSPGYCYRDYSLARSRTRYGQNDYGRYGSEYKDLPSFSSGLSLLLGYHFKKTIVNFGLEFDYLSYSGKAKFSIPETYEYEYHHTLLSLPVRYEFLIGKAQKWYVGLITQPGVLIGFSADYTESSPNPYYGQQVFSMQYKTPQFVILGGLEIGRVFSLFTKFELCTSLSFKYSSYIKGDYADSYVYNEFDPHAGEETTTNRNLMVLSADLVFRKKKF